MGDHKESIFILDDNRTLTRTLENFFKSNDFLVHSFESPEEALKKIEKEPPDYLLLDLKLPRIGGIEVLKRVTTISPRTSIIMMTAYGSIENAVQAVKNGAFHYIQKPFDPEEVLFLIKKAGESKKLRQENIILRQRLKEIEKEPVIVGESKIFKQSLSLMEKVANQDTTVLLIGKSGTGKELFAQRIHLLSLRKDSPFVVVNCAAIPRELLENELFGSEKGAYTGSVTRKIGKFEIANKGTLFLDEIAELHSDLQAKLLRAIERKEIERIGGTSPIKTDVRIIAATNRNLQELITNGKFREDLYYRLSVFPIPLPSLKERRDDIPLLTHHFLNIFRKQFGKPELKINQEVLSAFIDYDWPGNVRELENVLERACILCEGDEITMEYIHLPSRKVGGDFTLPENVTLKEANKMATEKVERDLIKGAIKKFRGNKEKVAKHLGISRKTLYDKLKLYGLMDETEES